VNKFKFFRGLRTARIQPGNVKLKDIFNRTKYLLCDWSEYPYDGDDSQIRTYQGNILEFYNYIKREEVYPTIYEIQKQYRGYQSASLVYGNRNSYNEFISRKFYLTIRYTLM
jgi:hypothetical protein